MATTAMFRRLLTLLAVLTPPACLHRPADTSQATAHLSSTVETVFRHYV